MAAIDQIRATIERCDEDAARRTLRAQIARLEREHCALPARVVALADLAEEQRARQAVALRELEEMHADPPAHKWRRLSNADLGRPGCTTYHVRPKLSLLGMLMGWWQVKVSGGCPLATSHGPC